MNCLGLLAALHRERTGRGSGLETNQFQSSVTAGLTRWAEQASRLGQAPGPFGSARPNIVPIRRLDTAPATLSAS